MDPDRRLSHRALGREPEGGSCVSLIPRVALIAPLAGRVPGQLATTLRGLLARGVDVHLVLGCEQFGPGHIPSRVEGARVHFTVDRPPSLRLRRLGGRGFQAVLEELGPGIIHFSDADDARRRLAGGALPSAAVISRFSAHDAAAGLETTGHFDPVWASSDLLEVPDEAVLRRLRKRGCPEQMPAMIVPAFVPGAVRDSAARIGDAKRPVEQPLRILSVGPLEWPSGYEHGAKAIALLKQRGFAVEWRVIGEGSSIAALTFACHQLGVDGCVTIVDPRSIDARGGHMMWADTLLAPAVIDGLSPSVAEALCSGLPVVMADPGPLAQLAVPEHAAVTVARRDPSALAAALSALALDPGARLRLSAGGRRWARTRFSLDRHLNGLEALYRRLASPRAHRASR